MFYDKKLLKHVEMAIRVREELAREDTSKWSVGHSESRLVLTVRNGLKTS